MLKYQDAQPMYVEMYSTDLDGMERNLQDLPGHAVAFFDAYYGNLNVSGNFFSPRQTPTACETCT